MSPIDQWFGLAPDLTTTWWRAYAKDVCPHSLRIFRALELIAPADVKVVILGQDPYHTPGKASGLAFGYHEDYEGPIDSSLSNIFLEMGVHDKMEQWDLRTLEHLPSQGVLLLNTCLTVLPHQPLSHSKLGWQAALLPLLQYLSLRPTVWLLWGKEAQKVGAKTWLKPGDPGWIGTSHPCRFSAKAGKKPFLGSGCFDEANQVLKRFGKEPIKWRG